MNDERLRIYISDHLALVTGEAELAERCHRANTEGTLGLFLRELTADLQAEQRLLKQMLEQIGGSPSVVKQAMAWLAEKAGRFKLNDTLLEYSELSRLVELETLFVAASERRSFWDNLVAARATDTRLSPADFVDRQQITRRHCETLAKHRIEAARTAL